ncbi:hypothetical protein VNO77_05470 [Canavalia gladiata]|uniref:AP2/ERF domain-containing protein n=1 Tax=Canavalia gladiata TaxID=3824 RepID=A0AAN9MZ45_CANGL
MKMSMLVLGFKGRDAPRQVLTPQIIPQHTTLQPNKHQILPNPKKKRKNKKILLINWKMLKPSNENPEEHSDSKYKGVRKRKWGKWVSEIRLPNSRQRIWLGSYDTAEKAARAFDAAMFCLRGCNATFNFPDNPPDIAGGRSMTPSQIQIAAARFANAGSHNEDSGRPESSPIECSSEGTTLQMESPSPSISEGTVQTDSDVTTLNGSLPDLFKPIGSGNLASEYGYFPGFDNLSGDLYVPEMPIVNYGEENMDGFVVDDSFLWNF